MKRYKDIDRDSNIIAYELGGDYIKVKFKDSTVYLYTYNSAGRQNVEKMKNLARKGEGLNSFIINYVKDGYESKLR